MIRALYFIFAIFVVTACQSTGVVPMGQGKYMIGKKEASPGLGVSLDNKAEVYKEANAFCHEKGLEVETVNIVVLPAKLAQFGSTELEFKCVSSEK